MARASPIIQGFNSGEWSPLMYGRTDNEGYPYACRTLFNYLPTIQGPATKTPGSKFGAEVKSSANRCWLGRFEFNSTQAYILEFGPQYIRFFSNHGVVGAPFEVVTPYLAADLTNADGGFGLRFVQSGDVLYMCHRNYAVRKLTRTGASTFTIATLDQTGGPFKDIEPTETRTIYASADTGAGVTLTASSAIFTSNMVGSLVYLEERNGTIVQSWEPGATVVVGDYLRSDGKVYKALNTNTAGSVKPVHVRGSRYDGEGAVQWEFHDAGFGVAKITGFTSTTVVTVTVMKTLPRDTVLLANATTRWALGDWSDPEGWPTHAAYFRGRLTFARDRKMWMSTAGDFEDFSGTDEGGIVTADAAINIDITSDRADPIRWLAPSDKYLLVGTGGDEIAVGEITSSQALGPGNIQARVQAGYGSADINGVMVGDGVMFVQRNGRKLRDLRYSYETERFAGTDITRFAEHILNSAVSVGAIDMAFQQEPDQILWVVRKDNQLAGYTIDRRDDVGAWSRHVPGADSAGLYPTSAVAVEAIAAIPDPNGGRNELWMIVKRTINGVTKRYVEYLESPYRGATMPEMAFFVNAGLTLYNSNSRNLTPGANATVQGQTGVTFTASGAVFAGGDVGRDIHYTWLGADGLWHRSVATITAFSSTTVVTATIVTPFPSLALIAAGLWRLTVTTITGLSHLNGESCSVVGDGAQQANRTPSGGSITLATKASVVHVGMGMRSILSPMQVEPGGEAGTAQGKVERIHKLGIRLDNSFDLMAGQDASSMEDLPFWSAQDIADTTTFGTDQMGYTQVFTGDREMLWPHGYADRTQSNKQATGQITLISDKGLPSTIVALMPRYKVNER